MTNQPDVTGIDGSEEQIDRATGWSVQMAHLVAESIEIAHEISPNSWSLYSWKDQPVFGAGFVTLATMGPRPSYTLMVDTTGITDENRGFFEQHRVEWLVPSRPWLARLRIPTADVPEALHTMKDAYLSALRRSAGETQTRCNRWKQHNERFRRDLENVVGKPIPEPGYLPELLTHTGAPHQSQFDPEAGWAPDMLSELANSILIAHAENPRSWDLRYYSNEIIMDVAMNKLVAISPSAGHFMVEGQPSQYESVDFGSGTASRGRAFDFEASWIGDLDPDDFVTTIRQLRPNHDSIIRRLAGTVRSKASRAGQHRKDILDFVSEVAGVELPSPDYEVNPLVNRGSSVGKPTTAIRVVVELSFEQLGLTYSPAQIATFYTALQTKGFVVLSGISGTGKSKIAQGFVELLPTSEDSDSATSIDPESVISHTVKPYMRNHARIVIPVAQENVLPEIVKGHPQQVLLAMNGIKEQGRLSRRSDTNSLYLYFRQNIAEEVQKLDLDQPLYLRPVFTGEEEDNIDRIEFLTSPTDLPAEVRTAENPQKGVNSLFLAVRPDWRDSTSLLGYYNPLTETYEWTDFLRFLLRAAESYRKGDGLAWFVILDEMNLAHVEYYFADLLSIIESGRDEDGWSREPIRLTYPDAKTDNPPPHEIYLPPNLYIIGTVNMDETTHAFSPKVLDRAFTIELTDVDFSTYPPASSGTADELTDDDRQALLAAFTRNGRFAQVSKDDVHAAVQNHPELRDWLQNLNQRLAAHQFHFGYRVFDEIAQFIHNADENGMFDDWTHAFDHAVYMKVLPKFNGSHARLHAPLTTTLQWANDPSRKVSVPLADPDDGEQPEIAAPRLDRVATRVQRMLDTLEANGFVSFG